MQGFGCSCHTVWGEYRSQRGAEARALVIRVVNNPLEMRLSPRVTMPNSVFLGHIKRYEPAYVWRSAGKIGPLASRLLTSFQVIESNTGRSGNCDLLLVVRSNCESISYRFETNGEIYVENSIFFLPTATHGVACGIL